jgi:hypothetical protein
MGSVHHGAFPICTYEGYKCKRQHLEEKNLAMTHFVKLSGFEIKLSGFEIKLSGVETRNRAPCVALTYPPVRTLLITPRLYTVPVTG